MASFAVIETGGKQYRVAPGQKLKIEKISQKEGENFVCDTVLLRAEGTDVAVGTPYVRGAKVEAKVLEQEREKKKIIFRYHSKTRYRKKKGHRQPYTEIEIVGIS